MKRVIAMAILSIALMGANTVAPHPACRKGPDGPELFASFVKALMNEDNFAIDYYLQSGCGFMKADLDATVLEEGPYWAEVLIKMEGYPDAIIYTSPGSITD